MNALPCLKEISLKDEVIENSDSPACSRTIELIGTILTNQLEVGVYAVVVK